MGLQCEVSDEDKMVGLRIILVPSLMISLSLASICQTSRCRNNFLTATVCCNSGKNFRCCDYSGGGGRNNNKPGSCPPYHGRMRRSPERAPWDHGGSGYNPGHHHHPGRCIRDSECPRSLKCCYLHGGYQCTTPQ